MTSDDKKKKEIKKFMLQVVGLIVWVLFLYAIFWIVYTKVVS